MLEIWAPITKKNKERKVISKYPNNSISLAVPKILEEQ